MLKDARSDLGLVTIVNAVGSACALRVEHWMLVRIMAALAIRKRLLYAPLLYISTITVRDHHLKEDGVTRETKSAASLLWKLTARVSHDDIVAPARLRLALA